MRHPGGAAGVKALAVTLQGVVLWFQDDGGVLKEVAKHF